MRKIIYPIAGICIILGVLSGCKSTEKKKEEEKKPRSKYSMLSETTGNVVDDGIHDINKAITKDMVKTPDFKSTSQNGHFLPSRENKDNDDDNSKSTTYEEVFKDSKNKKTAVNVTVNYDAANLADVIPSFSKALGFNYILDPTVKGTVTMEVNSKMAREDIWDLFGQILWMTNAYCTFESGIVHIRPMSKMPQERDINSKTSNVSAAVIPLKYVYAKDIVAQLKTFLSDSASATALESQNAVMVVETPDALLRLKNLISQLDQRQKANWHRMIINCHNIAASKIQSELVKIMPILGFPVETTDTKTTVKSGSMNILALDRMQVIIASSPTRESLNEMAKLVETLDRTDVGEQDRVFIYQVINGKAEELLQALSVIFATEGTTLTVSNASSTTTTPQTSTQTINSTNSNKRSSSSSSSSSSKTSSSSTDDSSESVFDVPVKVFADAVNNRLVIRTTPRTYAMVRALLERLDTIPGQVLLQVLVVEIELSNSDEFGIEFSDAIKAGATKSIFGTNYEDLAKASSQTGATLTIYKSESDNKYAYIRALATKSKMKIISSPQLLVASHSEAKISVGKRVPIISNEVSNSSSSSDSGTNVVRSYQYTDTGIILTVTPHLTKGGLVSMELEQTISDTTEDATNLTDSPTIKEDVLNTTLSLRSGRTLIMGGLIHQKKVDSLDSIPYIADIPILNWLVGDSSKTYVRTEIMMLITATIVTEKTKLEEMIRRYRNAVKEVDKFERQQNGEKVDDDDETDLLELKKLGKTLTGD